MFQVNTLRNKTAAEVDDLMLQFSETLGPLIPAVKAQWKRYPLYFDDQNQRNERMPYDRRQDDIGSQRSQALPDDESEVASNASTEDKYLDRAALAADIAGWLATLAPASERMAEYISPVLEDLLGRFVPSDMSAEGLVCVKALLRSIFRYDPEERPQAAELLKDPWFASAEAGWSRKSKRDRDSPSQEAQRSKRK